MIEIRNLIRETLEAGLINELAAGFMELSPHVGLVKENIGQEKQLSLFDFQLKKCIAIISYKQTSSRQCVMVNVASDSGLGPMIYELGMMDVYPLGLTPDRNGNLTPKAFGVWKVFHDARPDIRKIQILSGEEEYSERYINDDPSKPAVLNCLYFRTPSIFYKKLLQKGEFFQEKYSVTPQQISIISKEFFRKKYSGR